MSRPAVVLGVWAGFVLFAAVVLWAVFRPGNWLFYALPATAVLIVMAWAAVPARRPGVAPFVELSIATPALALGIAVIVVGLIIGAWMVLMGVGLTALGAFGVVREGR